MKGKQALKRTDRRETSVLPEYEKPGRGKNREKATIVEMERRKKTEGDKR